MQNTMLDNILLKPIGIVHSPFTEKSTAPLQSSAVSDAKGIVEIFPQYAEGLKDIEGFSHIFLLYFFHLAGEVQLVRLPFLDDVPRGIFAIRHPARPNRLGLSVVRLCKREGARLHVSGLDLLDGTPLLDIKPYIPRYDCFSEATEGWLSGKALESKPPGRE